MGTFRFASNISSIRVYFSSSARSSEFEEAFVRSCIHKKEAQLLLGDFTVRIWLFPFPRRGFAGGTQVIQLTVCGSILSIAPSTLSERADKRLLASCIHIKPNLVTSILHPQKSPQAVLSAVLPRPPIIASC
jgi:hypothetical protein